MVFKKLTIKNFRNIEKKGVEFHPNLTLITGRNSIGKTNLLESLYFISRGQGFRETRSDELIKQSETQCSVEASLTSGEEKINLRIVIDNAVILQKAYFVNRIKKRLADYLKVSPQIVIFSPILLYVIDGQPAERRTFFDKIIGNISIEYKKRLVNYETSLRRRNKLLEKEKNVDKLREELPFWDEYLIEQASYLSEKRHELINFLNSNKSFDKTAFSIRYIQNEITKERLFESFDKQFFIKRTLVGPQRDDFEIDIDRGIGSKNVHRFGSRSEQRLALFWLLINELKLIENAYKQKPAILLDDIFSELDVVNKSLVIKLIADYQTMITTTEEHIEDLIHLPHSTIKL